MKRRLTRPAGFGLFPWPYKVDSGTIIKAEKKCLVWTEKEGDGNSSVIKMYYRRGLVNFMRGLLLKFRAEREFRVLEHVAGCGIPCTVPLSWNFGFRREYGFCEILRTRRIPNTTTLKKLLISEATRGGNIDLGPVFQTVHELHRCGVYHGALSTKNILIDTTDNDRGKSYVIDCACSWLFPESILGRQIAWFDLLPLVRTIERYLDKGVCRPYLVRYGLEKEAVERLYRDAGRYPSHARGRKLVKNLRKVEIFFHAILTKLNQRAH